MRTDLELFGAVGGIGRAWGGADEAWLSGTRVGMEHGPFVDATVDGGGIILRADPWAWWPCYVLETSDGCAFATRLGKLAELGLEPDPIGRMERVMVGTPLGGRTVYRNVRRMRPGEMLHITKRGVESLVRDWWRTPLPSSMETFTEAVQIATAGLLGDASRVTALLSGGLDSRVATALLREMGVEVMALNFGQTGGQDATYARMYADAAGIPLYHDPREPHEFGHTAMARTRIDRHGINSDMPGVLWTGLAGSNIIGGCHATERMAALLRDGDLRGAVEELCEAEGYAIPAALFRDNEADERVRAAIVREFEHYATADMAHAFTLFLCMNRERSGGALVHEMLPETGLYPVTPFTDETVTRMALGIDATEMIGHRWYHRWLQYLPECVRNVPWQTYPGHEPCPIPAPELPTQWEGNVAWQTGQRRRTLRRAVKALGHPGIRQHILVAALAADALGVRDCGFTLTAAANYAD